MYKLLRWVQGNLLITFETVHAFGWNVIKIKFRSTPYFVWEVKPSAPCRNILWHVKIHSKYDQKYVESQVHNFLRQVPPDFLRDNSADRITRELWWRIRSFLLSILFHHGFPYIIVWKTCPLVAAIQGRSPTPSTGSSRFCCFLFNIILRHTITFLIWFFLNIFHAYYVSPILRSLFWSL
jgi:hypothetical protein